MLPCCYGCLARTGDRALNTRESANADVEHQYVQKPCIELCKILRCVSNTVLCSNCGPGLDLVPCLTILRKVVTFW